MSQFDKENEPVLEATSEINLAKVQEDGKDFNLIENYPKQ